MPTYIDGRSLSNFDLQRDLSTVLSATMQRLILQQLLQAARHVHVLPAAAVRLPAAAVAALAARFPNQAVATAFCSVSSHPWLPQHSISSRSALKHSKSFSSQADTAGSQHKRHAVKCNTAAGSPVSQAVACMVDRDVMPRQQLCDKMDQLGEQLVHEVQTFSSTELSAFAEACRKMEYQHRQANQAIMQRLASQSADITADELPSLLWAASTLASETSAAKTPGFSSSSSSSACGPAGGSSSKHVPQNDGVVGSVNSSRIADQPEVVEFMLGASQVLSGDMDVLDSQELPIIAAALERLEYRDPFLLTVLAETVLERKSELSEGELVDLLQSFAAMGRWFFDNRVLDQLTNVLVERAKVDRASQAGVERVAECLAGINHKNRMLAAYLEEQLEP